MWHLVLVTYGTEDLLYDIDTTATTSRTNELNTLLEGHAVVYNNSSCTYLRIFHDH